MTKIVPPGSRCVHSLGSKHPVQIRMYDAVRVCSFCAQIFLAQKRPRPVSKSSTRRKSEVDALAHTLAFEYSFYKEFKVKPDMESASKTTLAAQLFGDVNVLSVSTKTPATAHSIKTSPIALSRPKPSSPVRIILKRPSTASRVRMHSTWNSNDVKPWSTDDASTDLVELPKIYTRPHTAPAGEYHLDASRKSKRGKRKKKKMITYKPLITPEYIEKRTRVYTALGVRDSAARMGITWNESHFDAALELLYGKCAWRSLNRGMRIAFLAALRIQAFARSVLARRIARWYRTARGRSENDTSLASILSPWERKELDDFCNDLDECKEEMMKTKKRIYKNHRPIFLYGKDLDIT